MAIESTAQINRVKEFETVSKRNKFIAGLRKTKNLFRKRQLFPTLLVKTITSLAIADTKLSGHKNLDIASEKRINGEQITVAANHTADPDHPVLENVLESHGYRDFASHFVFPAGLKMWDREETAWGMDGMNTLPVAAPGYFDDAKELSKLKDLSAEQKNELKSYFSSLRWLKVASLKSLIPKWITGEAVPVVYPETTRSRDLYIHRGKIETDVYFQKGWILPLLIEGPGEVFPPEGKPNWRKLIFRQFRPRVTAGELISGEVLHTPSTLEWLDQRKANPVDFVMSSIVIDNPNLAYPEDRPLYKSLTEDIPEGLIYKAA